MVMVADGAVASGANPGLTPGTTVRTPCPATIEGVDVSEFQGTSIGWPAVKASGRQFAYARALDGIGTLDKRFVQNYQGIKAAGMKAGAYHFFRGWTDAGTQARVFIDQLQAAGYAPGDLLPVIDVEADPNPAQAVSPAVYLERLRTMEAEIERAIGTPPMIYTNPSFWAVTLGNPGGFSNNPLWIANYGNACPEVPNSWSDWTMFQYSQSGTMPGIPADPALPRITTDLDRFKGAALPSAPSVAPDLSNDAPPAIASAGAPYTFRFRAIGVPTPTYSLASGSLPPGVTLDPVTGALSGSPTTPGSSTFTVRAANGIGAGDVSSSATITIEPAPPAAGFHSLVPIRVLDSRFGTGFAGKVIAGTPRDLAVTGPSEIPATASAVVMNVTVVESSDASLLIVYPGGTAMPNASNLNFAAGQIIPNLVTVRLGSGGVVQFANAVGSTHVVADVVGYYDDGSPGGELFTPVSPDRILDSRFGPQWTTALGAGQTRDLQVTGHGGVPKGAASVVLNVTAIGGNVPTYVQVWPAGAAQPTTSNLNVAPRQIIPNLVTVKLGPTGAVSIFNAEGSTHVIADVVGYFGATGSRFHSLPAPTRIMDSRYANGFAGRFYDVPAAVTVTGRNGIPTGATGLVTNMTVDQATTESYLTVYPGDESAPPLPFSNLNFAARQVIPNLVTVGLPTTGAAAGQIKLFNANGTVYAIADAVGYYAP
jgi:GH25 family lysozyme M1 (1,4-beta-N-acetylmuramidase)